MESEKSTINYSRTNEGFVTEMQEFFFFFNETEIKLTYVR